MTAYRTSPGLVDIRLILAKWSANDPYRTAESEECGEEPSEIMTLYQSLTVAVAAGALVITQIPLLLKLWMEHRERSSNLKLELYKKHLAVAEELAEKLGAAQTDADALATMIDEGDLPDSDNNKFLQEYLPSVLERIHDFSRVLLRVEVFLPAIIVVSLQRYTVVTTRLWYSGSVPGPRSFNETPQELHAEASILYNQIFNQLRIHCGADSLSESMLTQISSKEKMLLWRGSKDLLERLQTNNFANHDD